MEKIRVIIADDHLVVREGLLKILESAAEFEIIGQAADGAETVRLAEKLRPDLVILDVQMPRLDGIEATRQIVKKAPAVNVVILTNFDQEDYIYRAIQAGAKGYVLKDSGLDELLDVIRSVARGEYLLAPHIAASLAEHIARPNKRGQLTDRELEVLDCLVRGLRNREIAQLLNISERTVKSHVNSIFAKLDVKTRTEAVSCALKENIIRLE